MESRTIKLENEGSKPVPLGSSSSSSGAEIDNSRLKDCFFSKLEDVLENAEIIITALRDLTYSSTDLTMGDTAEDVEEFLSQLDKFRRRINPQKENEDRAKKELKQKLIKTEAKLRDLEHSKEKELKESEDRFEVLQKKTEIRLADLEKSKREEIQRLQSSLSENEVNLEILQMENKNLEEKLRTSEEEAKVFKNELDLVKKEKLEGERKLQEFSVDFHLVLETLRDNGIVLRERKPTPGLARYFLSMASELPKEMEKEWEEMKVLNGSQVGVEGEFKTEGTSLPLEGDGDDSSEQSEDGEAEDISKTTPATASVAPEENDNESKAQSGSVTETSGNASNSSGPTPKRSARQKKKRVAFSPDRQEPPRKRMEQDPPPSENLISMTDKKNLERFQCKACGRIYQNRTGLTYHEKSVHLKVRFGCDVCAYQFTSEKGLEDHKKRCSQTGGVKICQQCKKRFKSLEELKDHQKVEHSDS